MMPEPLEDAIFAVEHARADLEEAILRISSLDQADHDALRSEAERFLLGLCTTVLIADGRVSEREIRFLSRLFPKAAADGDVRDINSCAHGWSATAARIPRFFEVAAEHCPEDARLMLRMIQIVGNNATIVDSVLHVSEHEVVRDCIARMESILPC